ncbi:MAG: S8 family peptidase [Lysobacter sp.]|nr:S8 family peptidase [Lysobacter sp.]
MRRVLNDDRVAFIEEDGMSYPSVTQSNATWGLDRVDQRDLPLNGTYVYDSGASNVRAYVIDTGILTDHNELAGRVLSGRTFISDGRGTSDCNGHGTHVAGTIAGTTWGAAKQALVVPVRVFGCTGGASNSTIAAAIDWVQANHVKPAVVNMSLGGSANSTVDTATNNLISAGVLAVVAAGNGNANACNYSPARVASALTVGATASNDARSVWSSTQASNFGSCLDLFAPGTSITSAWWTSTSATNTISGTSMASPHAAGTAALHLDLNPADTPLVVASAIINNATTGKVTNAGTGSPNRTF